jgi:hypothetical protein
MPESGISKDTIEPQCSGENTMSGSSKNKSSLWYGYLEAGNRSSPVIRDERLETGNPKTMFLFNLARSEILEYSRDIVESKLRELKSGETKTVRELDAAYAEARRNFKDRRVRPMNIPEHAGAARRPVESPSEEDFDEFIEDGGGDETWVDTEDE